MSSPHHVETSDSALESSYCRRLSVHQKVAAAPCSGLKGMQLPSLLAARHAELQFGHRLQPEQFGTAGNKFWREAMLQGPSGAKIDWQFNPTSRFSHYTNVTDSNLFAKNVLSKNPELQTYLTNLANRNPQLSDIAGFQPTPLSPNVMIPTHTTLANIPYGGQGRFGLFMQIPASQRFVR